MGLTGKGLQDQPRRARGCIKIYDKQQPQHDVATSHNAFRFITTTVDWRNCLFIRLLNLRGLRGMVKELFNSSMH